MPDDIAEQIRTSLRRLYLATIVLYVVITAILIVVGYAAWQVRQSEKRTNRALCSLREDLQSRVSNGEQFLKEHPHGIPGIPVKTLQLSINGQKKTITALSVLACPDPSLKP